MTRNGLRFTRGPHSCSSVRLSVPRNSDFERSSTVLPLAPVARPAETRQALEQFTRLLCLWKQPSPSQRAIRAACAPPTLAINTITGLLTCLSATNCETHQDGQTLASPLGTAAMTFIERPALRQTLSTYYFNFIPTVLLVTTVSSIFQTRTLRIRRVTFRRVCN